MKAVQRVDWVRCLGWLKSGTALLLLGSLFWASAALMTLESTAVSAQDAWISAWVDDLRQSNERWIQINISQRRLIAWEGNTQVFTATVSTGRDDEPTLPGVFTIQDKQERAWMKGDNYEIPNVPYTMYYSGNYAIHGAYWHDQFGSAISNGCVNLPVEQAQWLFNWASIGTPVVIEP
ncbi:MAG: hypothetical protein Kow00121_49010 [Elainellaceae cyanobacterium]